MSAVLTREFRTDNLVNFLNGYFGLNPISSMYMFFGEPSAWPADDKGKIEDDTGFQVPIPDGKTASREFRNTAIAGIRVSSSDVAPIIPRVNWVAGTSYNVNDVVLTDEWNVYVCIGGTNTDTKPTHTSYLDDDANWEFMYKISEPNMFARFVTNEWIPVNTGTFTGSLGVPHPDAIYKVGTITFMIDKTISGETFTQEELNDFRRIGIWSNVKDLNTSDVATDSTLLRDNIDTESGSIIYVDNRAPIYRYTNQTEEYKILIGF